MNAFYNKLELKNELLKNLKHHQDLDDFIQGQWLSYSKNDNGEFKGCFYGCTMQSNNDPIEEFSEKYNIDLWYSYLTEKIFEGLPKEHAAHFPYDSINIIPIGFDFDIIKSKFFRSNLLKQKEWINDESILKVLDGCTDLFKVPYKDISESSARSAVMSADSAARSVARSSAWSAARSAAWSAARSASQSAESARSEARSAAWSAARSAARSAEYSAESASSAAWSAARSARSAAWSSAASAADSAAWLSAESEADSAEKNHYIWMRDTLFQLIIETTELK